MKDYKTIMTAENDLLKNLNDAKDASQPLQIGVIS
jgi:hypothetical protein